MLGFLRRPRQQHPRPVRQRTMLGIERLETRDCPAAPVLQFTGIPTELGTIAATVLDPGSAPGGNSLLVAENPPEILQFSALEGVNDVWTFTGHVGEEYAGLDVDFSGLPSANGHTAIVDENGDFSLTITVPPGESGWVWVELTDWFGQTSNKVGTYVL